MNGFHSVIGTARAAFLLRFRRGRTVRRAIFDPECDIFLVLFSFIVFRNSKNYPRISLKLSNRVLQRLPELAMLDNVLIISQARYTQICALHHLGRWEQAVDEAKALRNNKVIFDALDSSNRDYIDHLIAYGSGKEI